ncbi:unnamed protein product [Parajaminaea phylloscopi]
MSIGTGLRRKEHVSLPSSEQRRSLLLDEASPSSSAPSPQRPDTAPNVARFRGPLEARPGVVQDEVGSSEPH